MSSKTSPYPLNHVPPPLDYSTVIKDKHDSHCGHIKRTLTHLYCAHCSVSHRISVTEDPELTFNWFSNYHKLCKKPVRGA